MRLHAYTGSYNVLELFRTPFYRYAVVFHDCFCGIGMNIMMVCHMMVMCQVLLSALINTLGMTE